MTQATTSFGELLRHWRQVRRFSQLELAMQADVSSKHVSFLETGRNRPSRDMILRLTQAMDLPLRDRNLLLNAAGFTAAYAQSELGSPSIEQAGEALSRILDKQEPYPAIVLDAHWNLLKQNRGAASLGSLFLAEAPRSGINALEMLFSGEGLQPFVVNWEQLSSTLLLRVFREARLPGRDDRAGQLFARLEAMPATPRNWREIAGQHPDGPTVDLVLEKDGRHYAFFTTITTFGTPQDVTLQELRIESYFPSDAATRALCESWRSD